MTEQPDLSAALERAKQFRQSWNAEDVVCDDSGLTAADLDVLIAHVDATKDYVAIPVLGELSELG
ncbi:hypothetical protein [Sphingomonas sp. PB4P5]|uniref:hypothetical protein n=1 Tax=Parasphingomonas puruogangriensis TaxID=3096155 RepID=UPI002FC9B9B8